VTRGRRGPRLMRVRFSRYMVPIEVARPKAQCVKSVLLTMPIGGHDLAFSSWCRLERSALDRKGLSFGGKTRQAVGHGRGIVGESDPPAWSPAAGQILVALDGAPPMNRSRRRVGLIGPASIKLVADSGSKSVPLHQLVHKVFTWLAGLRSQLCLPPLPELRHRLR
jgi:hypothetical protein